MNALSIKILAAAIVLGTLLSGCAFFSNETRQEDVTLSAQYGDAGIKTNIASSLLKADATKANDLEVHCYRGHVFLVGEADPAFRTLALDTAHNTAGVVRVTPHWFPKGTAATSTDSAIKGEILRKLAGAGRAGSNQLAIDVWGGHVVLLGLMQEQAQIAHVETTAQGASGVKSVTNYLALLPAS